MTATARSQAKALDTRLAVVPPLDSIANMCSALDIMTVTLSLALK